MAKNSIDNLQEIRDKILTLQGSLTDPDIDDEMKPSIQKKIDKLKLDEAELEAAIASIPAEKEQVATNATEADTAWGEAALASLRAMMKVAGEGNSNNGVTSSQVMSVIEDFFKNNKISLEDLDKDVLDEIKKNQTIEIMLPNFGKPIQLTRQEAETPFFLEVLDDMLAGSPIFLVGEAGNGKTKMAEDAAKKLQREYLIINCSQYTSPIEVIGGQTIEGYKDGKLIVAWQEGKVLIVDELPRLDPNTAGLFNDPLAKSSKTNREPSINSANPQQPPIPRNDGFAIIATGNVYPNIPPPPQYRANNQQDMSLLDRFSANVYKIEYNEKIDKMLCRFSFLYDMLIGNYYEYTQAVKNKTTKPEARGLRTVLVHLGLTNLAVVSYRTIISFRVAFEFQLVRHIAKGQGKNVDVDSGKTLVKAFNSFMVAFNNDVTQQSILNGTRLTDQFIKNKVEETITAIMSSGISGTLTDVVRESAGEQIKRYEDLFVADTVQMNP